MKLAHYLGGLEGLDAVDVEKRVFVEPWEKRIFGIHVAMMATSQHLEEAQKISTNFKDEWTWAHLRTGAEALNPFDYFKYRYYEKWLGGISGFFIEKGYITEQELNERTEAYSKSMDNPLPDATNQEIDSQVIHYLRTGDNPYRDIDRKNQFEVGQKVRIKNPLVEDHTRLPGFLREKTGIIDFVYKGNYTYFVSTGPDGLGEPMPSYRVRFEPEEIWGKLTEPNTFIYADLFEVYLDHI